MKSPLALACIAALLVGGVALAQTDKPAPPPPAPAETKPMPEKAALNTTGEVTVVKAETRQVTVRGGDGKTYVFQLNDKTRITRDGKPVTLTTITVGDKVNVNYEKAGDVNTAVTIGVMDTKAASKTQPPSN